MHCLGTQEGVARNRRCPTPQRKSKGTQIECATKNFLRLNQCINPTVRLKAVITADEQKAGWPRALPAESCSPLQIDHTLHVGTHTSGEGSFIPNSPQLS